MTNLINLRTVIEQRPDAIKFDFLIAYLRGIALRCTLVTKNIELNTHSTKYSQVSNKRLSDFKRGNTPKFAAHQRSDTVVGNQRSNNVVNIHRTGVRN